MKQIRFDIRANEATLTKEGFLLVPAYGAKVGVLEYLENGKPFFELIPEDELFKPESLASLRSKTITLYHPNDGDVYQNLIDSSNFQKWAVGHVYGEAVRENEFIKLNLLIQAKRAIDSIQSGDTREISMGYTATVDYTSGEFLGQKYDAIQRNLEYNHVALVPLGRAGHEVRVLLNSADSDKTPKYQYSFKLNEVKKKMALIRVNEMSFEVDDKQATNLQTAIDKVISEKNNATDKINQLNSDLQKAQGERDSLQQQLIEAQKINVDALVEERQSVINKAVSYLPENYEFKGKTNEQVIKDTLIAANPDLSIEGKSKDYINGCFAVLPKKETKNNQSPDNSLLPKVNAQSGSIDSLVNGILEQKGLI